MDLGTITRTRTSPPLELADEKQPSKRQLEIQISKLKILEKPKLKLEQYPISSQAAGELLYMAGFDHNDLNGRVIDLGTGTGRLAIGAALMGSKHVVGVDIDEDALALARLNAEEVGVGVEWIHSDIDKVRGPYDSVIMNPPYGTRAVHADVNFLRKALQIAPTVYSIHKTSTRDHLNKFVQKSGAEITETRSMSMEIPHLFGFHTKKWKSVEIDLYRVKR
jgi:predicted RNA methylase